MDPDIGLVPGVGPRRSGRVALGQWSVSAAPFTSWSSSSLSARDTLGVPAEFQLDR